MTKNIHAVCLGIALYFKGNLNLIDFDKGIFLHIFTLKEFSYSRSFVVSWKYKLSYKETCSNNKTGKDNAFIVSNYIEV